MYFPFRAKPRSSKKAKLNKRTDDNPEQTPEQFESNADAIHGDPPPEHLETFAEPMEDDPIGHATDPPSPARATNEPPSPAKAADEPPNPSKAAADQSDDVIVTGIDHITPGNPISLSKHSAKEEFFCYG